MHWIKYSLIFFTTIPTATLPLNNQIIYGPDNKEDNFLELETLNSGFMDFSKFFYDWRHNYKFYFTDTYKKTILLKLMQRILSLNNHFLSIIGDEKIRKNPYNAYSLYGVEKKNIVDFRDKDSDFDIFYLHSLEVLSPLPSNGFRIFIHDFVSKLEWINLGNDEYNLKIPLTLQFYKSFNDFGGQQYLIPKKEEIYSFVFENIRMVRLPDRLSTFAFNEINPVFFDVLKLRKILKIRNDFELIDFKYYVKKHSEGIFYINIHQITYLVANQQLSFELKYQGNYRYYFFHNILMQKIDKYDIYSFNLEALKILINEKNIKINADLADLEIRKNYIDNQIDLLYKNGENFQAKKSLFYEELFQQKAPKIATLEFNDDYKVNFKIEHEHVLLENFNPKNFLFWINNKDFKVNLEVINFKKDVNAQTLFFSAVLQINLVSKKRSYTIEYKNKLDNFANYQIKKDLTDFKNNIKKQKLNLTTLKKYLDNKSNWQQFITLSKYLSLDNFKVEINQNNIIIFFDIINDKKNIQKKEKVILEKSLLIPINQKNQPIQKTSSFNFYFLIPIFISVLGFLFFVIIKLRKKGKFKS